MDYIIFVAKTKVLICAFVFAHAKIRFSHNTAQLMSNCMIKQTKSTMLCLFFLFGLRLYVPVNNFSVMSGRKINYAPREDTY